MICPKCNTRNSERRQRCDRCGVDLRTGILPSERELDDEAWFAERLARRAREQMRLGAAVFGFGSLLTIVSYVAASASGRGYYVITWGAMLFGALTFLKGWSASRPRPPE